MSFSINQNLSVFPIPPKWGDLSINNNAIINDLKTLAAEKIKYPELNGPDFIPILNKANINKENFDQEQIEFISNILVQTYPHLVQEEQLMAEHFFYNAETTSPISEDRSFTMSEIEDKTVTITWTKNNTEELSQYISEIKRVYPEKEIKLNYKSDTFPSASFLKSHGEKIESIKISKDLKKSIDSLIAYCPNIKSLTVDANDSFSAEEMRRLPELESLNLFDFFSDQVEMETLPLPPHLKNLFVEGPFLKKIPFILPQGIVDINFGLCKNLQTLPEIPPSVQKIDLYGCEKIPDDIKWNIFNQMGLNELSETLDLISSLKFKENSSVIKKICSTFSATEIKKNLIKIIEYNYDLSSFVEYHPELSKEIPKKAEMDQIKSQFLADIYKTKIKIVGNDIHIKWKGHIDYLDAFLSELEQNFPDKKIALENNNISHLNDEILEKHGSKLSYLKIDCDFATNIDLLINHCPDIGALIFEIDSPLTSEDLKKLRDLRSLKKLEFQLFNDELDFETKIQIPGHIKELVFRSPFF